MGGRALLPLLLLSALLVQIRASDPVSGEFFFGFLGGEFAWSGGLGGEICDAFFFVLDFCVCLQLFYEPFDESFEGRWVLSGKDDYKGMLTAASRSVGLAGVLGGLQGMLICSWDSCSALLACNMRRFGFVRILARMIVCQSHSSHRDPQMHTWSRSSRCISSFGRSDLTS